jgi:hypothetical protein
VSWFRFSDRKITLEQGGHQMSEPRDISAIRLAKTLFFFMLSVFGETEAGSAGTQPAKG